MSHRSNIRKRERQKRRFKRFHKPVVVANAPIKIDRPSTAELIAAPGP